RQALLHKEFHLVFQPRVDLLTGEINSAEVLLRWIKADGKMISPGEFIPVLEEMGLITSVGEWVLMRACIYASQWLQHGHRMRISVNLSARQLRQPNLPDIVDRCLASSGLEPDLLELELTETSMLEDVEHSIDILSQLRKKGIRIAIDDFGTGYSSLAYLKKLPADTLKIDQAFVQELDSDDPSDRNIVQTIIQLAHNFNLSVTAEGIETEEQLAIIRQLGCNEAQGFLLAKPMNETELLHTKRQFEEKASLARQAQPPLTL
ncbi:EAL domain-containing protein, partial [Oceanospirillum sp. HFRX-1_2]